MDRLLCDRERLRAHWTDSILHWLGPIEREIDTRESLTNPIHGKRVDFTRVGFSGGDPGPERHPFAVWQIFGRRSKPHPQTILQWEFFLGLGDEKKKKKYLRTQIPVRDY